MFTEYKKFAELIFTLSKLQLHQTLDKNISFETETSHWNKRGDYDKSVIREGLIINIS
jgi:hypothetical protein